MNFPCCTYIYRDLSKGPNQEIKSSNFYLFKWKKKSGVRCVSFIWRFEFVLTIKKTVYFFWEIHSDRDVVSPSPVVWNIHDLYNFCLIAAAVRSCVFVSGLVRVTLLLMLFRFNTDWGQQNEFLSFFRLWYFFIDLICLWLVHNFWTQF